MTKKPKKSSLHQKREKIARKTFKSFARNISKIKFDLPFQQAIDVLIGSRLKGKIITTGMGKAGIAMQKFSSTLCSVGFPSAYLHPGEASHGDLGLLSAEDVLFVASTSGKTREILEIIDLARNVGVKTIVGITSHKDSPIRRKVDILLDMGDVKEEGHLGLAPTTSILVMLSITDVLSLIASEEIGFTSKDYGKYHHSGYLGIKARQM